MAKKERKNILNINRFLSLMITIMAIVSFGVIINTVTAASNLLKIDSVSIKEKSTTVNGSVTNYNNDEIDNSFTFHNVGDYVIYRIIIKNVKNDVVTINTITDDNSSSYIEYEYDKHENEDISSNGSLEFLVKATYKNAVANVSERTQASNVKFIFDLTYNGKDDSSSIDINPKTGDNIVVMILLLSFSLIGLVTCVLINRKSKVSKTLVVIGILFTPLIIKAASYSYDFLLVSQYGLYDKEVVTYTIDGVTDTKTVSYNETCDLPDIPSRTGYTSGWVTDSGYNFDPSTPITEDIKITATYTIINYNINYTLNDGVVTGTNPTTYNVETGEIVLKNPTKAGYTFDGWSGTGLSGNNNTTVTIPSGATGDRSYEAHFTMVEYDINYSGVTPAETASLGNPLKYTVETNTFSLANPSKVGYKFDGWTGSNGSTPSTNVSITKGTTGELNFTANFSIIDYSLSYELNGGTVSGTNPPTYNIETGVITLINPTKDGYTFTGWSGTDLTGENNTTVTIPSGATGNRSYEAHYSIIQYDINYSGITPAEAEALGNPLKYSAESSTFTLINPTKDGYTFTGWTGSNGSTPSLNVTILSGSTGELNFTANFTLIDYDIDYELHNGIVSGTNPITYNIETGVITLINPTKANYTFTGWSGTDLTGNDNMNVTIPSGSFGDREYEAHYTPTNYDITYLGITPTEAAALGNLLQYNVETASFDLINPTKNGYTFDGWTGSNGANPELLVTVQTGTTGHLSFTANFTPIDYDIGYELHGGSVSGTNPITYNIESGAITLINPTLSGYDFTGWSGTGLTGSDNTSVTIPTGSTGNRTYEAHYGPISYSINYSGITPAEAQALGNPLQYNAETATFSLINPVKAGYNFDGWTGSNGTTPEFTVTITQGTTGNLNFTANFTPIDYDIDYELNGGSVSGTNPITYNAETGVIVLINPTKNGYEFTGWSGTDLTGNDNTTVTIPAGAIGDRSYEAHYSLIQYNINYSGITPAEATALGNPLQYNIESNTFSLINPTKTGYNFDGWTGSNGTTPEFTVTIDHGTTGVLNYTANFTPIDYDIDYELNGGSVSGTNPITYNIESNSITLINPTKTGYTFTGWSGTDLTGNDNMSVTIPANSIGDRSYEAHFVANKYYVEFNSNATDAVGNMSNQEFTYDVSGQLTDNAYTRDGYIFDGWNTSDDGNGTPYANMANVTNLAASGTITLYAQWHEDLVTVTFNANGGDSVNPISIRRNTPLGVLTTPTNNDSHKIFVGWFINLTDVTPIDGTYAPSADITLIAKWRNDTDVCEMNGVYYATVQDAVNAAPASETSNPADATQVTINLLTDIHMTTGQNYVLDMFNDKDLRDNVDYKNTLKNIVLDMHGYGFYQPTGSGVNNYIMRTKGYLEMKNGYVESNSKKGAVEADGNKSRLTLNNMHIEAKNSTAGNKRQAVYNDGGTIYIIGESELIAGAPVSSDWPRGTVHTLNGGTTYILDATVTTNNSTGYAISAEGGTTVLGTKDNDYDTSKITVQGGQYGIWIKSSASVKIYDGMILNPTSPVISDESRIVDKENGYEITTDNDGTNYRTYYTITP
ncbi:MAG: InlB B-repeat-containing protein [Bacilli bacterium]|nr:InlB B-repeat-containing protein [Bacilli bacterium]